MATFGVVLLIVAAWFTVQTRINHMSAALDRLTASVEAENTVIDSVVTLLTQLSDEIRNTPADDSDALNKLADEVDAKKQALADAVSANTPAA